MGCDGTAEGRVGEGIERLEERFGSFPINQTTLDVSESGFETARERARAGQTNVYVRVRNDDGEVLHVRDGGDVSVPRCLSGPAEPLAVSVARTVRDEAGVECAIDGVARVTIAGIHNETDLDAAVVYRLIVLVDADHERGTPDGAVWRADDVGLPEHV